VIIGPWLRSFCDNFVLRWAYINQAINEFDANESFSNFDDTDLGNHPRNFLEYRNSQSSQAWNQFMYSKMWNLITSSQLPSPLVNQIGELDSERSDLAANDNSVSNKRVILTNTYLPRSSQAILAILMGSRPTMDRRIAPPTAIFDVGARSQLEFSNSPGSRLHAIAREMVRDQILSAYVEGFPALLKSTRRLRPTNSPGLVFTSNRHLYDDVFNTWVAQATERGSKYVIGQHGGNYGLSRFPSFSELHEADVSDAYLTWGWKYSEKQLPGPCLTTVGRKYCPSAKAKHLLIVCDHIWKYPRSLFYDISEHEGYLEYVSQCVTSLPKAISNDVLVRLNHAHADTGSSQIEYWQQHAPAVKVDPGLSNMRKLIRKSRLVATTYNGTTFLETLNLNIPTLITWNDSYVQLRPEAFTYIQRLEEAGIFHSNCQSFVAHVTKYWDDIESWWASDAVQSARLMFCKEFSRVEPHPLLFLRQTLRTVNMADNRPL
jgi:putative transferase (TIGR04331 family)